MSHKQKNQNVFFSPNVKCELSKGGMLGLVGRVTGLGEIAHWAMATLGNYFENYKSSSYFGILFHAVVVMY
jgi:hypothetical protein